MNVQSKKLEEKQDFSYMALAGFVLEFGFLVAFPIVVFILLGKYLNERFETKNFSFPAVGLSLIFSIFFAVRSIMKAMKSFGKK